MTKLIGALLAALFTLGVALGILGTLQVDRMDGHPEITKVCEYEDGDPSGQPCLWTDPDTGTVYVVDSSNYDN